jgi:hypothetical protein
LPDMRVVGPLLVFCVMVAAACWLVWRVLLAGGRVRRDRSSAAAVDVIALRAERELAELSGVVDGIRRRKVEPRDVLAAIQAGRQALKRDAQEAAELGRMPAWAAVAADLQSDIDRALRAVDLVIHGSEMLDGVAAIDAGEGETEVKRGYLNLVHTRDSIRGRREAVAMSRGRGRGGSTDPS